MSLASYATKSTLFTCDDQGPGAGWIPGVDLSPPDYESPGQTRWRLCTNDTRREGHLWQLPTPPHRNFHGPDNALPEAFREGVDNPRFEVPKRAGPHRIVDLERQRSVAQRPHPDVRREFAADDPRPLLLHHAHRIRTGDAELGRELDERVVQRNRDLVAPLHGAATLVGLIVRSPHHRRYAAAVRARLHRARRSPSSAAFGREAAHVPTRRRAPGRAH